MNAADRKRIIALSEGAGSLTMHAVAGHVREAMGQAYEIGFDAGKIAGIEEGRASAASLIAGLRSLLGQVEGGAVPVGLGPMLTTDQVLPPDAAEEIREKGVKFGPEIRGGKVLSVSLVECDAADPLAAEVVTLNTATGEIQADPEELAAEVAASEALLEKHPGINYPGYFPLEVPVGNCELCQGLGTVEGELYGEPCLVPCICEAGKRVQALGALASQMINGEGEPGDQVEDFPEVKEPDAAETFVEEIQAAETAAAAPGVKCYNRKCDFADLCEPDHCSVPEVDRGGRPISDCPQFVASGEEADELALRCCEECKVDDPDCSACHLPEQELREREAAEKTPIAPAPRPKCGNGACAQSPAGEKCVYGSGCSAFIPIGECGHLPARRFNDENGSLVCGVCGIILQASRRAAAAGTSPEPQAKPKAETELSPEEQKRRAMQEKCPHPAPFIATVPGRGEVCRVCDLVLTPESLPLFPGGEPVPPCTHPSDAVQMSPTHADNGEQDGFKKVCGECGVTVARLDLNRRAIPPEEWPENRQAGKVVEIKGGEPSVFTQAEKKILAAGFTLARFERPDKDNIRLWSTKGEAWEMIGRYRKFVDGERALEDLLKDPKTVQVDENGNPDRKSEHKLTAAGFEFYRMEKGSEGVSPKIKVGSKNWGMLARYKDDAELAQAWEKLMNEDPLALAG